MKYFLSFVFFLSPFFLVAQKGHYYLHHHSPGDESIDPIAYDIAQGGQGLMYFATKRGIIQFDGKHWDLISGKGAVYSIDKDKSGKIFWAGVNGFGVVSEDRNGEKKIEVLSQKEYGDFYQTINIKDEIFFLNERAIYKYTQDTVRRLFSSTPQSGSFTFLFQIFDQSFISTDKGRIFRVDKEGPREVKLNYPEPLEIIFTIATDKNFILVTSDSRLFSCSENMNISEINIDESKYLSSSVIVSGVHVKNNLVALGTLRGGVVFLNLESGRVQDIINYNTGLPDNEVYSLLTDINKNVWVAHEYGFTIISPFLPYRTFSHFDGLRGNLLCAITYNDQVYVGTSLGLFKLVKKEVYDEIIYYEDVQLKRRLAPMPHDEQTETLVETTSSENKVKIEPEEIERKKGFLNFLKRKKQAVISENQSAVMKDTVSNATQSQSTLGMTQSEPSYDYYTAQKKRIEKVLRDAYYEYERVESINGKITHMLEAEDKLIVSGLAGIYQIDSTSVKTVWDAPVRGIYLTQDGLLLAPTYDNRIETLQWDGKDWISIPLMKNVDDQVSYIFEGRPNELWLCGLERIYRFEWDIDGYSNTQTINFPNPKFSKTIGMRWNNKILFINEEGFYQYDYSAKRINHIDTLSNPKTYFNTANSIWYYGDHSWNILGNSSHRGNTHLLNILSDVRFISARGNPDNIWIITGSNELYKFFNAESMHSISSYPLHIKSISQGSHKLSLSGKVIADQDEGEVVFEVAQPNYISPSTQEYRYFIRGINDDWSDWNSNSIILFPFLPAGQYILYIQSRDLFGVIHELDPIRFSIQPPFWKSGWFYAMEFSVFVLLVMLSFRLSVRYRLISRILSLLTIILLIEFIQTVVGYTFTTGTSPILDFVVQVLVAFTILPVEGYLRNLMSRSMGAKSKLYDVISEMDKQKKRK